MFEKTIEKVSKMCLLFRYDLFQKLFNCHRIVLFKKSLGLGRRSLQIAENNSVIFFRNVVNEFNNPFDRIGEIIIFHELSIRDRFIFRYIGGSTLRMLLA
jgi:hypothetical protein